MKRQTMILLFVSLLLLTACIQPIAAPTADTTAPTAETAAPIPTPAAPVAEIGLGDAYFPLEGNPGYDVQHYTIELTVASSDLHAITGTTTIEALATADLSSFNLDFLGLEISAITVDGAAATFSRDGQELTVTPATPIAADATFAVAVSYAGTPATYHDPALAIYETAVTLNTGWREWGDGYIAAMSQPDGAMAWFPCNNHPADKATFTFRITIDDPKLALASGILQEVIPVDEDTNTYVWVMDDLMSTQVTTVILGEFELQESVAPNGVPIRNYFPPNFDQTIIDSYANIGDMLVFLEGIFGPYPFDAYGVVAVPGWIPGSGYETQSLTTLSDTPTGEDTVVHELGHQWFSDALTVKEWDSVWLHEGFARYIEPLWAEHQAGPAAYDEMIKDFVRTQLSNGQTLPPTIGQAPLPTGHVFPAVDQGVPYMYFSSYEGGALTLHALRMTVGDETFFTILKTFYARYQNVPVITEDFVATAEEVAGRDLSTVWEPWLYGDIMPTEIPLLSGATITLQEIIAEAEQAAAK
jgi:aminopeptidase N